MDNANHNITKDHLDELGAASINITLVRCMQAGRSFLTGQDFRASQIIMKTLQALGPCLESTRHSAPQTLGTLAEVQAFGAVERALAEQPPEDRDIKNFAPKAGAYMASPPPAESNPPVRPTIMHGSGKGPLSSLMGQVPEGIPTVLHDDDVAEKLTAAMRGDLDDRADMNRGRGLHQSERDFADTKDREHWDRLVDKDPGLPDNVKAAG